MYFSTICLYFSIIKTLIASKPILYNYVYFLILLPPTITFVISSRSYFLMIVDSKVLKERIYILTLNAIKNNIIFNIIYFTIKIEKIIEIHNSDIETNFALAGIAL